MNALRRGENALLTPSGQVHVELTWQSPHVSLDPVCFIVTASEQVLADEWFLFYNQRQSPGGAVRLQQSGTDQAGFVIDLDALPANVQKCVFAGTLEGMYNFSNITEITITGIAGAGERLAYRITDAADEQALIFAEIYRHSSGWKMRAVGQGFRGGLEPLARHYGVNIGDEPPDQSPQPGDEPPLSGEAAPSAEPAPFAEPAANRWGWLKWVLPVVILGAGLAGAFYYFPGLSSYVGRPTAGVEQNNEPKPTDSASDNRQVTATPAATSSRPYVEPTCGLTDSAVFERYHSLGDNYIKITKIVNNSNQTRAQLRQTMRDNDFQCSQSFVSSSRQEIERLKKLPITEWMQETTTLNICAGLMSQKVETALDSETRPAVIQKLVREADKARNLESDLTNIARDLAYYRNKTERLLSAYESNLEVCPPM